MELRELSQRERFDHGDQCMPLSMIHEIWSVYVDVCEKSMKVEDHSFCSGSSLDCMLLKDESYLANHTS